MPSSLKSISPALLHWALETQQLVVAVIANRMEHSSHHLEYRHLVVVVMVVVVVNRMGHPFHRLQHHHLECHPLVPRLGSRHLGSKLGKDQQVWNCKYPCIFILQYAESSGIKHLSLASIIRFILKVSIVLFSWDSDLHGNWKSNLPSKLKINSVTICPVYSTNLSYQQTCQKCQRCHVG